MNLPTTRKEAMDNGNLHYFTGKKCPHGHTDKRYTVTSACVSCVKDYHKKSQQRFNAKSVMVSNNFDSQLFYFHPSDRKLFQGFHDFISASRLDPRRTNDIELVKQFIESLELAWSFQSWDV